MSRGRDGRLQQLYGRNELNGRSHVCAEVFGLRAVTEFMSWRERWAERLAKCTSARRRRRGGGVEGVRTPLGNKVGQASFIRGRGDCTDLQRTHKQSPGVCSSTKTKCSLSSSSLSSSKPLCVASLITARGDPLHIQYTPSPETATQQTAFSLQIHTLPHLYLGGVCITVHCFFCHSLPMRFVPLLCLLIIVIFF